jgi:hypothetical protein
MKAIKCDSVVRLLFSVLVLALAALAGPVLAQKVDRPIVHVGDWWQFAIYSGPTPINPYLVWVVTSITADGIKGTESDKPLSLTLDLNNIDSPRRSSSDLRLLSFPLEIGKQWTFADNYVLKDSGETGRSEIDVMVVSYEKVLVPAGEFDAFKLEAKGSYSGSAGNGRITQWSYWYAPAARAIVKEEFKPRGHDVSVITQLEKFYVQP